MSPDFLMAPLPHLTRAEDFLESIIEDIPNMIFVKEARELRFVRFNRAGEELLGYSRQELIGKNDYDFFPKEEADFFVSRDRAVLASGRLLDIPEEPIHTRSGGTRLLHTKKIPMIGADGQPLYLLGISEDITDRKRVAQVESELARVRTLESLGRLAGGVAHDFNNLVTGIYGITSELYNAAETPPRQREDLKRVLEASEHATKLIRQLLAFGRRQGGAAPQVVQFNDLLSQMHPLLARLVGPSVQIGLELAPDLPPCRMDSGEFEQIVLNLVLNARDAMPQGGEVRVRTANRSVVRGEVSECPELPGGNYAEVTVQDTGSGMSETTRQHAFEPFFTTKPKEKGTGLGLSTVYGIIKRCGGDVCIRSRSGEGTAITFWVPPVPRTSHPSTL